MSRMHIFTPPMRHVSPAIISITADFASDIFTYLKEVIIQASPCDVGFADAILRNIIISFEISPFLLSISREYVVRCFSSVETAGEMHCSLYDDVKAHYSIYRAAELSMTPPEWYASSFRFGLARASMMPMSRRLRRRLMRYVYIFADNIYCDAGYILCRHTMPRDGAHLLIATFWCFSSITAAATSRFLRPRDAPFTGAAECCFRGAEAVSRDFDISAFRLLSPSRRDVQPTFDILRAFHTCAHFCAA